MILLKSVFGAIAFYFAVRVFMRGVLSLRIARDLGPDRGQEGPVLASMLWVLTAALLAFGFHLFGVL